MSDRLFLFPETLDTNPSSFLQTAIATISRPIKIENFKLFAFIECIDEVNFPFVVAPVNYPGKSVMLYQYRFSGKLPDFKKLGFKIFPTENGEVLFLSSKSFSVLSSKYRSISIKSGHWPDVASEYHQLAAYSHLDVIPTLSQSIMKSEPALEAIHCRFQELYDNSVKSALTLPALYIEVVSLLQTFCFAPSSIYTSPDGSSYYFGAIRPAISTFHEKCFSTRLIGACCLTPASIKQLRAMQRMVKDSLTFFGYEVRNDFHHFLSVLHRFQTENGLSEDYCNEATFQLIWKKLLTKNADPISALSQVGVPIRLDTSSENEKFGEINSVCCDDAGKKLVNGISKIVSSLPAPGTAVVAAQKHLLSTAKSAADQFKGVNVGVTALEGRLESMKKFAIDINEKTENASNMADSSLNVISKLSRMNKIVAAQVNSAKLEMNAEMRRTNSLVIILLLMFFAYFIQKYHLVSNAKRLLSFFKKA